MSKELKREVTYTETIAISEYDPRRCSRNCDHCYKEDGIYHCFRNNRDGETIEGFDGFDDVDSKEHCTADTYGFKRTDSCLKDFGGVDNG